MVDVAPSLTVDEHYLKIELEALIRNDPSIWTFLRQSSLDGVWYWDLDNPEHEYISPEFWEAFGYDPATKKHLASEWQELIDPDDLQIAKENLAAHMDDPAHHYDQIVRYLCADGSTAWVRCRGIAVRNKAGRAIRMLGAHTDLTALKAKELEAKRSTELLSQIMNTTQGAIIALGFDHQVLSINKAGRHFLGGVNEPTPFPWPDDINFIDNETYELLGEKKHPISRSLKGAVVKGEVSVMTRTRGRDHRYVRVSSSPVSAEDSNICCVLVLDDVSEQEMNRQQVERTSRLDALGQLTGGIAHDFNNLLATVQYALQLASNEPGGSKRNLYLETAMKSVERGSHLTKRLLAFAKQQPGLAKSGRISEIMSEFQKLAAPVIEANIRLDFIVADLNLWVYCDLPQLENALLNLLLNARDAILRAGHGNHITVLARGVNEIDEDITLQREHPNTYIAKSLYAEQGATTAPREDSAYRYVEFAVTDNGPGMTAQVKQRAIDPFFTTKKTNSGTGLGLSMVYGFVQQSNGELRIYSEADQGTAIRILLPRGTEYGTREGPVARMARPQGTGETILVVEDESNLLMMLEVLVQSLGYKIKKATSSSDVLQMIDRGERFDVMLTDVIMPGGLDGFELARQVRQSLPDLPILYMSGYTGYTESDMAEVVAPMLEKPCPPDKLANAIRDVLDQQPAQQLIHQS
ncbi:MAG: PAS domain-containing protein [Pseudomonadota bacterium]